jgi:hypothetical protein
MLYDESRGNNNSFALNSLFKLKELSSLKMHNGDDWHASIKTLNDASDRNYPK